MKNKFQKSVAALFVIACAYLTACQHQESLVTPVQPQELSTGRNAKVGCFQTITFVTTIPNFRNSPINPNNCIYDPANRCYKAHQSYRIICWLPEDIFQLPCPGAGCPEDLFKRIDWWIIPDFRKQLVDPEPQPNLSTDGFLFPITRNVLGMQFYAPGVDINQKTFTLKSDLVLPLEVLLKLQVAGKIIRAGSYPVIYNPQFKTFNALVTVQ